MGISDSNVFLFSATRLDDVMREMYTMLPRAVIVDSIQTVYLDEINSSAGSIVQVGFMILCPAMTMVKTFLCLSEL